MKYRSLIALAFTFATASYLSGCHSELEGSNIALPDGVRQISAINPTAISLEIRINNGRAQIFSGQGLDNGWIVPLNAPASSTNTISVTWIETYQEQRLILASKTETFTTDTEATTITLSADYTTNGSGYDFDSDGVSNLEERMGDSNPLVPDSGSFVINEPETVSLEAGCFIMGSPDTELLRSATEVPHQACVNAFGIGKYEVTFEQYDQFAIATGRDLLRDAGWGRGALPVIYVSLADAISYTAWLSDQTSKNYRLPTEAEWEYAARAGTTTPFSTGETITSEQAHFNASVSYNGSPIGSKPTQTVTVGSYEPNPWGIHDMHGNVAEWTCSSFSTIYAAGAELSCEPNPDNSGFAFRGGSWVSAPEKLRSAARARDERDRVYFFLGFRVAID